VDNQSRTFLIDLVVIAKSITSQVLDLVELAREHLSEISIDSNIIIIHHTQQNDADIPYDFTTFQTPKHSAAQSRNIALERTTNEAVIFLDDDTLTLSQWAKDIRLFLEKPYLDIVCFNTGSAAHTFDSSSSQNGKLFKADTAGMAIKRSLLEFDPRFDESLMRAEDCDFVTTAIRKGFLTWFSSTKILDQNKNNFITKLILKRKNKVYLEKIFAKHFSSTGKTINLKREYIYFLKGIKIDGNVYILDSTLIVEQINNRLEINLRHIVEKNKIRIIEEI
jgi:hypothetical protein